MLTLRGHHLICLNFFSGEGYDEVFVRNLKDVLQKAESEAIEVCDGVDDVCIKCQHLKDYKCKYTEDADEEIREMDDMALRLLKVKQGSRIKWQDVREKISKIFSQWFENYCCDCDWLKVCKKNQLLKQFQHEFIQGLKGGI